MKLIISIFISLLLIPLANIAFGQEEPEQDLFLICTHSFPPHLMYIQYLARYNTASIFFSEDRIKWDSITFADGSHPPQPEANAYRFESWRTASFSYLSSFTVNQITFTKNSDTLPVAEALSVPTNRAKKEKPPGRIAIDRTTTEFNTTGPWGNGGGRARRRSLEGKCDSLSRSLFHDQWSQSFLIDGDSNERQKEEIRSNRAF